jgi:hypothetical protein
MEIRSGLTESTKPPQNNNEAGLMRSSLPDSTITFLLAVSHVFV